VAAATRTAAGDVNVTPYAVAAPAAVSLTAYRRAAVHHTVHLVGQQEVPDSCLVLVWHSEAQCTTDAAVLVAVAAGMKPAQLADDREASEHLQTSNKQHYNRSQTVKHNL